MKRATVADLRNHFRRISAWIEHGETVLIIKQGKPFARLSAERSAPAEPEVPKVDFLAQLREVWGDRVFSDAEVRAMQEPEREREGGEALHLGSQEFLTFDAKQRRLAEAEGLVVPL